MKTLREHIFWLFFLFGIVILALTIAYRQTMTARTPPGWLNTFTVGNSNDYHQYMNLIKRGREGHILYHNAWSEEDIPDVLLQPIYNLTGFISGPFPITLYDTYYYFSLFSLLALLISVYFLIRRMTENTYTQMVAALLFFSATGYWWITSLSPFSIQTHLLVDFNFNLFMKFHVIPPHHNIAIALLISALLLFTKTNRRLIDTLLGGVCAMLLAFIHPFILLMLLTVLFCLALFDSVSRKRLLTRSAGDLLISGLFCLLPVAYMIYMYKVILRFDVATAGIMTYLPRAESFASYVQALGPVLILAIPSLIILKNWKSPLVRFLMFWAFVPIILFFFPDLHIPMNTWRLFQVYQHIPMSLLGALSVSQIITNRRVYPAVALSVGIIAFLYGAVAYGWSYQTSAAQVLWIYDNIFISPPLQRIFAYLDSKTRPDSVVLTGESLGSMIPEFTHNRTIVGHNGNNRNYLVKLHNVRLFFAGYVPLAEVRALLSMYNVSYIIFGEDNTPPLAGTPYKTLPFLQEVFKTDNGLSVVAVLPDK